MFHCDLSKATTFCILHLMIEVVNTFFNINYVLNTLLDTYTVCLDMKTHNSARNLLALLLLLV